MRKYKILIVSVIVKLYYKLDWSTAKQIVQFHYDFKKK
jgi:hypothetical protein